MGERLSPSDFSKIYRVGYRDGADNRWIPVKVEIPQAGMAVNITYVDAVSSSPVVAQALFDRYSQQWRLAYGKGAGRMIQQRAVLAWQPLPHPYKADVNETKGWQDVYKDMLAERLKREGEESPKTRGR